VHNIPKWDLSIHLVEITIIKDGKERTLLTVTLKPEKVWLTLIAWSLYNLVRTHFRGTKKFITYKPVSKLVELRRVHGLAKLD
jgi:hypothetical protein